MFQLNKTIVWEEILEKEFVCNLSACKGACCVDGDAGAPLEESETKILKDIYSKVKPFLRPEGIKAIEEQGHFVHDKSSGAMKAPLIDNEACAYVTYENGIALCGIEKAHSAGKIDFQKPLSCHLYPIRITKYNDFDAVNYELWDICDPACKLGQSLQVPLYKFLKDPLIRKYGEEFYQTLEAAIEYAENSEKKSED